MVGTVLPSKQLVPAPLAIPARYSLFAIAEQVSDGERWQAGIEWAPEAKTKGDVRSVGWCGTTASLGTGTDRPGTEYADPFDVFAEDHCSTLGWQVADYLGRAQRALEAVQSFQAAAELETGTLAQADSLDNKWLTKNPTVVGGSALSATRALGQIEMGLAALFAGRRCMVHVSPALLTELHSEYVLELSGNKYLTPMGHTIVADAGYSGAHPDSGHGGSTTQWMYGSLPVQYRLSPIEVPDDLDTARAFYTDTATNLTRVYAQRLVLLEWDGGVVAAETNVPVYSHS